MDYEVARDELLSTAVVRSVSAVEGREPLDLPPLATVLDTDALDVLFATDGTGEPRSGGRLSFIYSESHVIIENGEYLSIQPLGDAQTRRPRHPDVSES